MSAINQPASPQANQDGMDDSIGTQQQNATWEDEIPFNLTAEQLLQYLNECADESDCDDSDTESVNEDIPAAEGQCPDLPGLLQRGMWDSSEEEADTFEANNDPLPGRRKKQNPDTMPYGEDHGYPTKPEKEARFFQDASLSPTKATLLFYLNSGLFRFEHYKNYCAVYDGQPIDLEKVKQDIAMERLTPKEFDTLIRKFYERHSFTDFTSQSCATCGIRHIEHLEDPSISYTKVPLAQPEMAVIRYTPEQTAELFTFMESPEAIVSIPVDEQWTCKRVNLANARSFFVTQENGVPIVWHVHPELVDKLADGSYGVSMCPICHDAIIANRKIPKLSIAAGVDFGYYVRLGLTSPNLHEQLMLARTRLYFALLKVSSNIKGQVNMNDENNVRCHAILFPHNASNIASFMYGSDLFEENGMLNKTELLKLLSMYMVDPDGRPDSIAKSVYRTVNLFARPHVIAQWLVVLKWCNPHYRDINVEDIQKRVQDMVEWINKSILANATVIDDPEMVEYEHGLGSDVAQARNVETVDPGAVHEREERMGGNTAASRSHLFNDISYSYVTNNETAYHLGDHDDYRLHVLRNLADLADNNDGPSTCEPDDCCNFNEDDVRAYLHRFPPNPGRYSTARGEVPLSDFEKDDKSFSTSFPNVFMLGTVYGKAPGCLTTAMRSHLLNQFHLVPAKDRRLLGFLFDVRQRQQVMKGVKAHVEGNKDSIKAITNLLRDPRERQSLKDAIAKPYASSSKQVLRKYIRHLVISSKDVAYGVLEGSKLKHRLLGSSYRYSAPTCFLTISPGTIDNPRSIRLAFATSSNGEFPSRFEEGCPYGSNGEDFADRMVPRTTPSVLSEGYIQLPRCQRAEMAIENPVAFVQEYKVLLNDIFTILFGATIEDPGFYSRFDSSSKHRSYYFKIRKGIFGHCFCVSGVTEAHEKGTLHWHFTIHAGISPYVLQTFAHLPDICNEISLVIDSMYMSSLPADIQAGGLLQRFLEYKKSAFGIHDSVIQSIHPPETLPTRKDPTTVLASPLHCSSIQSTESEMLSDNDNSTSSSTECLPAYFSESERSEQTMVDHTTPRETTTPHFTSENNGSLFGSSDGSMDMSLQDDDDSELLCFDDPSDSTKFMSLTKVHRAVAYQGSCTNFHSHHLTCHKGSQGKIGCRMCYPNDTQDVTGPVELVLSETAQDPNAPMTPPGEDRPRLWEKTLPKNPNPDDVGQPKHHLVDILQNHTNSATVIVWETKRPIIDTDMFERNPMDQPDPRTFVISTFYKLFSGVPSFGKNNRTFWHWMTHIAGQDQLLDMYLHVRDHLPASNGFIAAFNPILSLCTGAHNNASLLGSLGQAKSALFYLIPYQGKTKFPLMGSLTILDHALKHIEKHKSVAADSGTMSRTVKHLLTRVINRIHLQVEISDYQIAAALLELPSMIMSDRYTYGDAWTLSALRSYLSLFSGGDPFPGIAQAVPTAHQSPPPTNPLAYRTTVQHLQGMLEDDLDDHEAPSDTEDDLHDHGNLPQIEDNMLDPSMYNPPPNTDTVYPPIGDLLKGLGYTKKVHYMLPNQATNCPGQSTIMPVSAFYLYRGADLANLNYYEYLALTQFVNKKPRASAPTKYTKQLHFQPHDDFIAKGACYHVLLYKHHTPLLFNNTPRHPGRCTDQQVQKWKFRANFYAKYYLSLFRPEDIDSDFGYTWEDLQHFIASLQQDSSIISKFRLMVMHQHMSGMKVSDKVKKMTLQYRGRKRDLWTQRQRMVYEKWQCHQSIPLYTRTPFDEEHIFTDLPQSVINQIYKRLRHDTKQVSMFRANPSASRPVAPDPHYLQRMDGLPSEHELDIQYDNMINWKPVEPLPTRTSPSCNPTPQDEESKKDTIMKIRARVDNRGEGNLNQQLQLFDCYSNALLYDPASMPKIALIHGPPGVGKSYIREAISDAISACGRVNDNTAFNSIHAMAMKMGVTTCSDTGFNVRQHLNKIGTFSRTVLANAIEKMGLCPPLDVVNHIDEVGTQAPAHLARKSALCAMISDNTLSFGGRPTLLYGDLTQIGPVKAGHTLTQAVMDINASDSIRTKIVMPGKAKKARKSKVPSASLLPGHAQYSADHPYTIGARITTQVRWFELQQQNRIKTDQDHQHLVERLYHGLPVTQTDIKNKYKLISCSDLASEEWLQAPILVATNRERLTFVGERAKLFAVSNGSHVIRWPREMKDWEQQPTPDYQEEALENDPVCWEYFVPDALGFLNENVKKNLLLVNAMPVRYHSIRYSSDYEVLLRHEMSVKSAGETIDMPVPPEALVVELLPPRDHVDPTILDALHELSLERPKHDRSGNLLRHSNRILIPLHRYSCSWDNGPTIIRGGSHFLPSRAIFKDTFPVELAFSITVHKAQGRTLRRVIIALSSCGVRVCEFTFSQLLVALSRVTDGDHIRLLLTGTTEEEKWNSITYINNLKRDPSIAYFFAGFQRQNLTPECINDGWLEDTWSADRANANFERMLDEGLFTS